MSLKWPWWLLQCSKEPEGSLSCWQKPATVPPAEADELIPHLPIILISILILLCHLQLDLQVIYFHQAFTLNFVRISHICHARWSVLPYKLPLLVYFNDIWWRVRILVSLLLLYVHRVNSSLLDPSIIVATLFTNTLNPNFSIREC
jgi:hypothetical protein